MDSASAVHKDGIMTEANILNLTSTSHNTDKACGMLTKDAEEEENEKEAVPKPMRPALNHCMQEKPVFPGKTVDPSHCIALDLRGEDRVPYTINRYLRDYQREGIRFIYNNYIHSTGCILGDDMGLGKTVQIIGFLAAVLHKTGTWTDVENNRPQFLQSQMSSKQSNPCKVFLIVAPLSVLYNWKDELDTWGYFQSVVVHGLRKEEELARIRKGRIEVALTTYETLRLCLDQFNTIDWSAVVVDEVHKIKNPNSQITQAMKELRCKIRFGLTGTILQNNLEELWCVMDWAAPGCLGSLGYFKNNFSDPIEQGQRHSATKRALATGRRTAQALVKKICPLFLRRTKALIKEQLPKKDDRVAYCSLTDFQQTVYQAVLDSEDVTLLLRSSEKCDCLSGRTRGNCCYKKNSKGVCMKEIYFSYLAILRKVSNHAALLQPTPGTSKKQEKYLSSICATVFHKFPEFVQRCKTEAFEALSDPTYSGKMKVLQMLLKYYLQKRDKVLIFSLSTKLLDILESYCMAEGLDFSRLDGSTKSKERVQIVKEFNSSSHVNLCLVSIMAGGLGLNFVGANVVVLFDPTWNPANDLQAIDRAYRIGQCRDVTVFRLISLGTVEEVIYLRQIYKQQLQSSVVGKESARRYFEAVQRNDVYKGELFGIKNLFRLQMEGTCLTCRILEREGQVEAGVMTTRTHRGGEKVEETKGDGEPGDPLKNGPLSKDEAAEKTRDTLEIPSDLLDFSCGSGSEDEEVQGLKRNPGGDDDNKREGASSSPGRMGLLQLGFSKLLERVKEKPDAKEDSSSSEEAEDQRVEGDSTASSKTSSPGNTSAVSLPKCETKNKSSDSDGKHEGNGNMFNEGEYAVRRRQGLKRGMDKQTASDDKSDENSSPDNKKAHKLKTTVPDVHLFDSYSDESDDLDFEAKMCCDKDGWNPYKRDGGRGKADHITRRHSAGVRSKAGSRYREDIETFTSSEDEQTTSTGRRASLKRPRSPASTEKKKTIDHVLGGLQEVVYTHSNQRVVGGSKAEELISRAAVRDVFECKMFSQLPANNLLGTQESLPASPPSSEPPSASVQQQRLTVDHPVIFTGKSVHQTQHATVIVGETPKAIRRQQLEQMAEKFKFASVQSFAVEILRGNSSHRLSWLQQYYTSQNHADLAKIVTAKFPEPDSAQSSSTTATSTPSTKPAAKRRHTTQNLPQKEPLGTTESGDCTRRNPKPKTKTKSPQNNVSLPQIRPGKLKNDVLGPPKRQKMLEENAHDPDVPGSVSEEQEEMVCRARGSKSTKNSSVASSGPCRAGVGLHVEQASSSGQRSEKAAAFLSRTDRDTPSSSDLGCRSSALSSKPTAQETEQELPSRVRETSPSSSSCNQSFLMDLLGDTSILDDLLKPRPKNVQRINIPEAAPTASASHVTHPPSSQALSPDLSSNIRTTQCVSAQAKGSHRDIWDILDEGNEESINKLTDPLELQRVCISTSFAARGSAGQRDSKSLWKTNDKFLWKK
nr:DNA excision repair protein ERCC-6-like 2 [Nothobranchius furzeri]